NNNNNNNGKEDNACNTHGNLFKEDSESLAEMIKQHRRSHLKQREDFLLNTDTNANNNRGKQKRLEAKKKLEQTITSEAMDRKESGHKLLEDVKKALRSDEYAAFKSVLTHLGNLKGAPHEELLKNFEENVLTPLLSLFSRPDRRPFLRALEKY
ncbi:RING zinc finger-containing protein, partial [Reticulomyxa filosa]